MRSLVMALAMGCVVSTWAGDEARAADVILKSVFQGGDDVQVKYTGQTSWQDTTAGAFTATPTSPSGPSFDAFCVSLNVPVGTTTNNIHFGSILALNTVTNAFFTNSAFGDVGNRLAFLLTAYGGGSQTSDSALALAVWDTIDKNFTFRNASWSVVNRYNDYTDWAHNGYNAATLYGPSARLLVADPVGSYQNLIGLTNLQPTPEPSSLVLAAVGLGAAGLAALRRSRRGASAA